MPFRSLNRLVKNITRTCISTDAFMSCPMSSPLIAVMYLRKLKLTTFFPPSLVPLFAGQFKRNAWVYLCSEYSIPAEHEHEEGWHGCWAKLKFPCCIICESVSALKDLLVSPQIVAPSTTTLQVWAYWRVSIKLEWHIIIRTDLQMFHSVLQSTLVPCYKFNCHLPFLLLRPHSV